MDRKVMAKRKPTAEKSGARAAREVSDVETFTRAEAAVLHAAAERASRAVAVATQGGGLIVGSAEHLQKLQRERLSMRIELDFAERKLEAADALCTRMANQTTLTAQTFFDFTRELRAILDRVEPR